MIKEIFSFYKTADQMESENYKNQTLGEFLKLKNMSNYFIKFHIIPMISAIWSVPTSQVYDMPMDLFIKFFRVSSFGIKKKGWSS